jgi:hypothetical protein
MKDRNPRRKPMSRSLTLVATFALLLFCSAPSRGQDSPSLGDLARQAQKDKANKPPVKVITNDDIPSTSNGASSAPSAGPSVAPPLQAPGKTDTPQSPAEGLERLQSQVDALDSLDRAALVSNVLEGEDRNFPGRAQWEEKLFAAKQTFVAQNRAVLQQVTQIEAAAQGIKDVQDANDPRVKSMNAKLQEIVQEARQNAAAFQAVMAEGKTLAGRAAGQ